MKAVCVFSVRVILPSLGFVVSAVGGAEDLWCLLMDIGLWGRAVLGLMFDAVLVFSVT